MRTATSMNPHLPLTFEVDEDNFFYWESQDCWVELSEVDVNEKDDEGNPLYTNGNSIPYGLLYFHYIMEGKIYSSCIRGKTKPIIEKKVEKLTLFDFEY